MVMTSQMYHILFEKPKESEYMIIANNSRKRKPSRKGNKEINYKRN